MTVSDAVRRHWPLFSVVLIGVVIAGAGFALWRTMPPRTIVMATGAEGGAYHEVGKLYSEILARAGVRLRLQPTGGAIENLALLRNPRSGVSIALLQGGTASGREAADIESLGTVFYEPLWLFTRRELQGQGLEALRGKKVSVGVEGGGSRALALELLGRRGIDERTAELLPYAPQAAGDRLLAGEINAAVMLVSWDSPVVRRLVADARIALASFPNIDAYVALYPYLSKVVLPAGVGDLANNRPPSDVTLVALNASLVVRKDTHSAIQYLLLTTAAQVHSGPGIFQRAGQFPSAEAVDIPLSSEAAQFYKSGRPFLQNYLPFWMASLVARLLVLLIPIIGILYPLLRFLPACYGWMMRRKISRLYGELRYLEDELEAHPHEQTHDSMVTRLDRLEYQANHLRVPAGFASMQYMLRNHIDLVRARLAAHLQNAQPKP